MKVTVLNNGPESIYVGPDCFPINPGKFAIVESNGAITLEEIKEGEQA